MGVLKIVEIASSKAGPEMTTRVFIGAESSNLIAQFMNNVRARRLDPKAMTILEQQAIISEEMAKVGCFRTED